jgi:hypothetical protein
VAESLFGSVENMGRTVGTNGAQMSRYANGWSRPGTAVLQKWSLHGVNPAWVTNGLRPMALPTADATGSPEDLAADAAEWETVPLQLVSSISDAASPYEALERAEKIMLVVFEQLKQQFTQGDPHAK